MSLHTPGPWTWDDVRDQIIGANGSIIAKLATGEDRKEEDANARLLSAAPQLLHACEMAIVALSGKRCDCENSPVQCVICALKTSITKAYDQQG